MSARYRSSSGGRYIHGDTLQGIESALTRVRAIFDELRRLEEDFRSDMRKLAIDIERLERQLVPAKAEEWRKTLAEAAADAETEGE